MNRETYHRKTVATLAAVAAVSATGGSNYVDTQNIDSLLLLATVGDLGSPDGSNNLVLTVQEADDTPAAAGSYSTVAAADLRGDVNANGEIVIDATADESQTYAVAYVGNKRYVRMAWVETGTISGPLGVIAIGEHASRQPASNITLTTGAVS